VNNSPITLYISYSIHLCRNWMSRHQAKKKNKENVQSPTRHGEPKASRGREFQRPLAPNSQRRVEGEKSRNGEWKASPRRDETESKGPEFSMANNILARRAKAAKTPQSWRGRNSLVKKHQLAKTSIYSRGKFNQNRPWLSDCLIDWEIV